MVDFKLKYEKRNTGERSTNGALSIIRLTRKAFVTKSSPPHIHLHVESDSQRSDNLTRIQSYVNEATISRGA